MVIEALPLKPGPVEKAASSKKSDAKENRRVRSAAVADEEAPTRRDEPAPRNEKRSEPQSDNDNLAKTGAEGKDGGRRLRRKRWWIAAAIVVPLVLFSLVFAIDRAVLQDRVLRGVSVWGIDLSGLRESEIRPLLDERRTALSDTLVVWQLRDQRLEVRANELGFQAEVDAAVDRALNYGREGNSASQVADWLSQWTGKTELPILVSVDGEKVETILASFAQEAIDDAPKPGGIGFERGTPVPEYPEPGWVIDYATAIARATEVLGGSGEPVIDVPLVRQVARQQREDVDRAVARAKQLLSGPITLRESEASVAARRIPTGDSAPDKVDEPSAWQLTFAPSELAAALRSRPLAAPATEFDLYFDPNMLRDKLKRFRDTMHEPAVDARFDIDKNERITIVPSRSGTRIDETAVAKELMLGAEQKERVGQLPVEAGAEPEFSTKDAEALHIRELVAEYTTYHPCCQPRVKNIHRIAEMLDGVVVHSGSEFSVNEFVGPRTEEKGFLKAPSIADGEMVDTAGGGISQFATTFFNALLDGGYDIIERQAHSFYFSRYPAGHEATLSYPKPDLIFKNDTKAGVLIRTQFGKSFIRVKLYGDREGRKVTRSVSNRLDIVEPETDYIANDKLDPDEEEEKEPGSAGWSIRVTRTITYADGTKKEESRKVRYKPRSRVVEVHSCRIPKKKEGYTGKPCPKPEPSEEDESEAPSDAVDPYGEPSQAED